MFEQLFAQFSRFRLLACVIIAQVIGAIWYGPLFSKRYMKENGFTEESMKGGPGMMQLMLLEILSTMVFFIGLGLLLQYVANDHKREIGLLYFLAVLSTKRSDVIRGMNKTWRTWFMGAGKMLVCVIIALLLYGKI